MKKVGILGGTFNPPHIGHLIIANEVRIALQLDEVLLMPTAIPPHKSAPHDASADQRLYMTKLAVQKVDGLNVSSFEVDQGGVSYTFETMKQLNRLYPDTQFHFIIGGDMIDALPSWHKIDELIEIVTLVGVNRPGAAGKSNYPVLFVTVPQTDVSSSLIRLRIADNIPVQLLIPQEVEDFIRKEGLYGSSAYAKRS